VILVNASKGHIDVECLAAIRAAIRPETKAAVNGRIKIVLVERDSREKTGIGDRDRIRAGMNESAPHVSRRPTPILEPVNKMIGVNRQISLGVYTSSGEEKAGRDEGHR